MIDSRLFGSHRLGVPALGSQAHTGRDSDATATEGEDDKDGHLSVFVGAII